MLGLAQAITMDHFDNGPAVQRWLFESPVPTIVVLMGAALIAAYLLRQGANHKWAPAPLIAGIVLSTGLWSLSAVVDTDRELIEQGTRDFIQAMTAGDRAAARSLIDKDVFVVASGVRHAMDGDEMASAANAIPEYVQSYNLREVSMSLDGERVGRTRFDITLGMEGSPLPMGWELAWQRRSGTWTIVRAECVHVMGRAPGSEFARRASRLTR